MAKCEGCFHRTVCDGELGYGYFECPHLVNTSDVVPRAEVAKIFEEIEELLKDTKDDYRLNDEIREACAVRYAMTKVADLKKKYTEDGK